MNILTFNRRSHKFTALVAGLALLAVFSGTYVVRSALAQADACAPLSSELGLGSQTLLLESPGVYDVWARVKAEDQQPSFTISIDGAGGSLCDVDVSQTVSSSEWTWIELQQELDWSGGEAYVQIAGSEAGVGLDCVVATQRTGFDPSSLDDCSGHPSAGAPLSITNPLDTTTVEGVVTVQATIHTSVAIDRVTFYVNGDQIGQPDTQPPYEVEWDTTRMSNGGHSLTAVLTDTLGDTESSTGVNVIVDNAIVDTQSPEVSITVPDRQLVTSADFAVTVDASDNAAIDRVELRGLPGTESYDVSRVAPFSLSLPYELRNDDYDVEAVAYDTSQNSTASERVTLRLRLPDFNRDGSVGIFDLSAMLGAWNTVSREYDLSGNDRVGVEDLARLLRSWGSSIGTQDVAPSTDE